MSLLAFHRESCALLIIVIAHLIKHEELSFGSEEDCVGDTRKFQITLSPYCYRSRIKSVAFFCDGIHDICNQDDRRFRREWIEPESRWIRDQKHVGFVNSRPASK